jgi:superoxide dismutase
MENQYTVESLKEAIKALEAKQANDRILLKEQLLFTYESLKPSNILKSIFKDFASSENLKNEFVNTAVAVTSGFITKKVIIGKSNNLALKLLGLAFQFGITSLVSKNYDVIKDVVNQFINRILGEKEKIKE